MKKLTWFREFKSSRATFPSCESLWVAMACGFLLATSGIAVGQGGPNYDVRATPAKASPQLSQKIAGNQKAEAVRTQLIEGKANLASRMPGLEVSVDDTLGIANQISNRNGVLSKAVSGNPEETVKSFVSNNHRLFGLDKGVERQVKTKASYENPENKLKWVTLQQEIGGVPVFRSELKAALTEGGDLAEITNEFAPGLSDEVLKTPVKLTAEDALLAAARDLGVSADAKKLVRQKTSDDGNSVEFKNVDNLYMLKIEQVVFPVAAGEAVLAWQVLIGFDDEGYVVVVDAQSGETLFRKNLKNQQTQAATFLFFEADNPAPGTPWAYPPETDLSKTKSEAPVVAMTEKTLLSEYQPGNPNGWIPDYENTTRGNNVFAYRDQAAPDGVDQDQMNPQFLSVAYGNSNGPSLFNRNFRFSITPGPDGTHGPTGEAHHTTYNNATVTNMFFWTNRYHDIMYRMGFTEAAGNFQAENFGKGGHGDDQVLAEALDYLGRNNANFLTPPDGTHGRMQMYVWTSMAPGWPLTNSKPARDSALDQLVLIHELTHGTTNRLVGNSLGLNYTQGGGLGEGWSDFFAISIMSEYPAGKDQDPDKTYPMSGWLTKNIGGINLDAYFYGIRPFPYSTNKDYNPLTYADSDPHQYGTKDRPTVVPESPRCLSELGAQVHNLGHLWATILWEARAKIMHSFENAGYSSVAEAWKQGNRHMLQLVTDGLKLTPSSPTFIEARNAILRAALLQTSSPAGWVSSDPANPGIAAHDEARLWAGFAARGLGYKASSPPRFDSAAIPREPENWFTAKKSGGSGSFPPPPDAEVLKELQDDDSVRVDLPQQFTFYGQTYTHIWVNTNGTITFGTELRQNNQDLDTEISLKHHFSAPRISGLLTDLDGATTVGTISVSVDSEFQPSVTVTFRNVPEAGAEPGEENTNSFQIRIGCDRFSPSLGVVVPGTVTLTYGVCTAQQAIVGLSPGPNSPGGPFYTEDSIPAADEDLSELGICNPELSGVYFTEFFTGPGDIPEMDDLFDLEATRLSFSYILANGWNVSPRESYETPLQPQEPTFVNQDGEEALKPGDTVQIRIPLENQLKKANLTNVLGLLTPVSEGVDVIDPISDYKRIDAGKAAPGADPFIIRLADDIPCGAQVQVKVDFTSDQGVSGSKRNIVLTVGGGFGDPQGSLSWPQSPSSGVVGAAVDANATQLTLSSHSNMRSGTNLKNSRTGEIIQATGFNSISGAMTVKRGHKGTTKAAMNSGDNLVFDSVPIPDATGAGVGLPVFPTNPDISGPVGRVKVKIGKLTHPNIGDLRLTLSNAQGYKVVLMEGAKAALGTSAVFTNITLDTSASLSIQNSNGIESGGTYRPVEDFSAFQNIHFDAGSTWTLTASDLFSPYVGDIAEWSIELTPYIYCETPVVASTTFENGTNGWVASTYGTGAHQTAYHKAATGDSRASLVLHTDSFDSIRAPQWRSPGVQLSSYANQVYRFNAWISRSGQSYPSDQSQIPWMRLRAGVGDVMIHIRNYLFDTTQIDGSANTAAMSMAPSTSTNSATHYWVDLDPVDVPSLYANPEHKIYGAVENISFFPNHQGNFEVVETRVDRYSAPPEEEATQVWHFTNPGVASVWSGHYANPITESDSPYSRPKVTTTSLGLTIDSTRVQPVGSLAFATTELDLGSNEVLMSPNHLYRVRYHVSSNTPSSSNPIMRLRTRSVNWADAHELILGPSNFGLERDRQLGAEILPGLGTMNPNRRGDEQQGGYYDQFVSAPPITVTNPEFWKLRLGFDLIDLGYNGNGSPEQMSEGGRFTLDSIEVREYRQR